MHDLHVADRIHKLALESAENNKLKKVTKINIELGTVIEHGAAIDAENLKFNIIMLSRDSIINGADINIEKVAGGDWKLVSIEGE